MVVGAGCVVQLGEVMGRERIEAGARRRTGQVLASVAGVGHRAQAVHGAVHRELRRAEPLHHIAAAGLAALLEDGQDAVRRREPALDALRRDRAPGHHAVPVEKGAGEGVGAHRGVRLVGREQGPAAGHGRRTGA
ncbi:hypothetical protein GCM10011428_27750 [Streptomyces violaceus]